MSYKKIDEENAAQVESKDAQQQEFVKGEHWASWKVLEIKREHPEKPARQVDNMKADADASPVSVVTMFAQGAAILEKVTQESLGWAHATSVVMSLQLLPVSPPYDVMH